MYYLEEYGVIVFAQYESDAVYCLDVFGETKVDLCKILLTLKGDKHDKVVLGFTPKIRENFLCCEHSEEDTTLFVCPCGKDRFELEYRMFPLISHA